jgi:2-polyprenyl-3-methyl-5-hydroxy-6-metoxy-1,4-benzoquinol methylase
MSKYVWQHDLKGESDRLRLMSDLLDPSSEFHLLRIGVATGWRCLEIGAGNGSLSQWLAQRVGPTGHVIASDIHTDLMNGIAGSNLEVRKFDVVHDEPPDAPYDLVAIRALLHHLPERRAVVSKMARWLKPGGQLFVQEPDFYPTWTVEPPPPPKSFLGAIHSMGGDPSNRLLRRTQDSRMATNGGLAQHQIGRTCHPVQRRLRVCAVVGLWHPRNRRQAAKRRRRVPRNTRRVIFVLSRPDLLDDNYCVYGNNRAAPNPHLSGVRCEYSMRCPLYPPKADIRHLVGMYALHGFACSTVVREFGR